MFKALPSTGAALVASALKAHNSSQAWNIRYKPVCASTEILLSQWLEDKPLINDYARVVLAARQRFGKGQYERKWSSPKGGIWLSAALPFSFPVRSSGLFGLAVAVAVAKMLQDSLVPVSLKWPNDLMVYEKKLAGFLPRVISRGDVLKYARVGIGLNVRNRVSSKAISLAQVFSQKNISVAEWTSKILISLENTLSLLNDNQSLCREAEKLLYLRHFYDNKTGKTWEIEGLNNDGSLSLKNGRVNKSLYRWD
tara:strand:+ start:162 stop:920 length:759 start_codon:yes stop_codon:yes gene_type:complete